MKEEDFSRITDILKGNSVNIDDKQYDEFLTTTPRKQLFSTFPALRGEKGGILKTPGTASKPKNVSFAPGNTHFSAGFNYSEDATPESLQAQARPPITPLQPNESTFRGMPGRFPSPWVKTKLVNDTDLTEASQILPRAMPSAAEEDMKVLVDKITVQLLENNQQLNNLRKVTKKDMDKTDELKQQLAQCARLLSTALEERRDALEFAYVKDQENISLRALLSEERRKNIKLMKVVLASKGESIEDQPTFDRDKVLASLDRLNLLSNDISARYANSKPILAITDALLQAPRTRRKTDYAELKALIQHQLILLKLPDSPELSRFLQHLKSFLDLIS